MNADINQCRSALRTVDPALLTEQDRLVLVDLLEGIYEAHPAGS